MVRGVCQRAVTWSCSPYCSTQTQTQTQQAHYLPAHTRTCQHERPQPLKSPHHLHTLVGQPAAATEVEMSQSSSQAG